LRKLLATAVLACTVQLAQAAEAGKIIFVAGQANVGDQGAVEGAWVQEGQLLSTGADGFIYVKTIDNGLFILRPQTKARIVSYHIDNKSPANSRIKLELLSGVARSKSGDAVKLARQNFRFNTPVAAIGVRGTDFTVFTDNETSRVAVISGGVVVSGFVDGCRPEGSGPCEGAASRELSATQRGQLVQVRRGQAAQVLQSSPLSPDQVSPPRSDEPLGKSGSGGTEIAPVAARMEADRNASLNTVIEQATAQTPTPDPPPDTAPPATAPPPSQVDTSPPQPERGIIWGRWQPVVEHYAQINLSAERKRSELLAINGSFALFRTPGKEYVAPNNGSIGFALKQGEAYIYTDYGYGNMLVAPASLSNGALTVDFGSRTFATSMDLTSKGEVTALHAQGAVTNDGRLYSDAANGRPGYINLQGLLSKEGAGSAAYIFDGRLDALRTVNGGTSWQPAK